MRQGQSLVMTPQLLQAIKLLQFSNLELASFVQEELERNPLLERVEETRGEELADMRGADPALPQAEVSLGEQFNEGAEADWSSETFATDRSDLEKSLGTELGNSFDDDRPPMANDVRDTMSEAGLSATSWSGSTMPGGGDGESANLESYLAARLSLKDHLLEQLPLAVADPADRLIGHSLIDAIDDAGYLTEPLEDLAGRLGTPMARIETVLAAVQTLDPVGVGARNLSECLAIQLRDLDRYDPAMAALVANLDLVAKRDIGGLKKLCGVDEEDIADMIAEIRRLDPKPGRAFGSSAIQPVVPDVNVRLAPDGSWLIELNADVLPRLLVNQTYAAKISRTKGSEADRSFVSGCLQTANWLTKSLEHLRPLNLKAIADATGMHESTVSRVTSNKYLSSPRGLFELKYFFTASIASNSGGEAHSAESVRFRIKQMIERESVGDVLSDDAIVERLRESNIDIARRTVAKYRESMRIPSSVERRRRKAVH
jgi:RNA polymerase sigma-54 factor